MKKELQEKLYTEYPKIFIQKDLDKTNYLKLIGTSPAGDNKNFCLGKNECVKIFTGSKIKRLFLTTSLELKVHLTQQC